MKRITIIKIISLTLKLQWTEDAEGVINIETYNRHYSLKVIEHNEGLICVRGVYHKGEYYSGFSHPCKTEADLIKNIRYGLKKAGYEDKERYIQLSMF